MSEFVTCHDCDQKVKVKPGKSSAPCPACGAAVSFASASAGKSSRRGKDDEDDGKAGKPKPKRKYRKEWDEDDDGDDDRRKAPPKQGGSLLWLWILLGVLALVVASCAGVFFFMWNVGKNVRDQAEQRRDEFQRQVEEDQRRVRAGGQPGMQNFGNTNRPGKGPAAVQPHASDYDKKRPAGGDPAMSGPGPIYLDDLTPFAVTEGPYKLGRHGALGSPEHNWVVVSGTFYDHSISMVPPDNGTARASFAVDGQARTLSGKVAMGDIWNNGDSWGEVTYTLYKDGKQVWQSKPRKSRKTPPEAFNVDITGGRVIMLETKTSGSSHDGHAVWLDPTLTK